MTKRRNEHNNMSTKDLMELFAVSGFLRGMSDSMDSELDIERVVKGMRESSTKLRAIADRELDQ